MAKSNLRVVEDSAKKEEKIVDYIKSLAALEKEMEPYKEQKRDLKQNYVSCGRKYSSSTNSG